MLAAAAGILEGTAEGKPDEALGHRAAGLCRDAGADPAVIPEWIAEGRRRAARGRAEEARAVRRLAARAAEIIERMSEDRPQADRILVAQITGEARHRARWRDLTEDEEAEALAELRELAGGRADLLAEVAGLLKGTSEGEPDEPLAGQASWLCLRAGADPEAIPGWVAEGRRRRDAARKAPPSGGVRGG